MSIFKLVINLLRTVGVPKSRLNQEILKLETTLQKDERVDKPEQADPHQVKLNSLKLETAPQIQV